MPCAASAWRSRPRTGTPWPRPRAPRGPWTSRAPRRGRAEDRAHALRATQDAAWTEIARLEADTAPEAPTVDLAASAAAAATARSAADRTRASFEAAERAHREAARALEQARAVHTAAEQAWAAYRARREALQHERDEVERARVALEGGGATNDPEEAASLRDVAEAAREAAAEAGRAVDGARAELERDHAAHAAAHAEAGALARAAERLRAAFEARRGYAQGPRVALTSGIAGVRGSVADLFRVTPGREAAIAGALGRRAEYVVVDTAETAEKVLAAVRRASGWATVLPARPPAAAARRRRPGVGARARACSGRRPRRSTSIRSIDRWWTSCWRTPTWCATSPRRRRSRDATATARAWSRSTATWSRRAVR